VAPTRAPAIPAPSKVRAIRTARILHSARAEVGVRLTTLRFSCGRHARAFRILRSAVRHRRPAPRRSLERSSPASCNRGLGRARLVCCSDQVHSDWWALNQAADVCRWLRRSTNPVAPKGRVLGCAQASAVAGPRVGDADPRARRELNGCSGQACARAAVRSERAVWACVESVRTVNAPKYRAVRAWRCD